jgi:hypothetical protein
MTLNDVLATFGRRDVIFIVGLGVLSVLLWNIPVLKLLFYPFRILNTFIHELSHGLAAAMTGGSFVRFVVRPDMSGTAYNYGGATLIVAPAGYLGSALFGGFLILLTTASIPARVVLMGFGLLLGLLCLLFVANCYGIVTGWILATGLFYAGWKLDDQRAATILLFLAVQLILASFDSLFILLHISRNIRGTSSDAERMEKITAIPAAFWALLWCATAITILIWSVTMAYRDMPLR